MSSSAAEDLVPVKPAVTIAALIVSLSASVPAAALCVFDMRFENGAVRWNAIPGAAQYRIVETVERKTTNNYYTTTDTKLTVQRRSSTPIVARYFITAEFKPGVLGATTRPAESVTDSCSTTFELRLPADEAFRKLTRKAVLPLVASGAGANGAKFRTALTMRGSPGQRGRIVFRPMGRVAADDDPFIRYDFGENVGTLHFDDVVSAIVQGGSGSIEIIPDDDGAGRVPAMDVYLYNETPNGTFGTFAPPALPYDYLRPDSMAVTIPGARFRVNAGFRTLTDVEIRVAVFGADGRLRAFFDENYPAGWMQLTSAAELARTALAEGETLLVIVNKGSAIPFHTITENATNDPTLVIGPARRSSLNVSEYVD